MFPFDLSSSKAFDAALPEAVDVVVIGGGVIGVTTALYLAKSGVSVLLLEKGRIAAEQSSRNWGWIRQQGRDPDELPIMVEANRLWRELGRETNTDIGLRQAGVTYLARDEKELAGFEAWLPFAKANGVDTQMLSAAQTYAHIPGMQGRFVGAIHTASDMRAEPWVAVPALAQVAVRAGAILREECAVRALDIEAGRIAGVVTEAGQVRASQVVLAGGAWSALFLKHHGVFLPQLSVRATVAATGPLPEVCPGGAATRDLAFRHRSDGGYSLAAGGFHELFVGRHAFRSLPHYMAQLKADPFGTRFLPAAPRGYPDAWGTRTGWEADQTTPFERMRILNPNPNKQKLRQITRGFQALFPHLRPVRLRTSWSGMIDTMPDVVPVVDRVAALPGLILGTGMSGHGFGIGPGIGRVLSSLVQENDPGHDLTRFRLARFNDGSKMELGPAL